MMQTPSFNLEYDGHILFCIEREATSFSVARSVEAERARDKKTKRGKEQP